MQWYADRSMRSTRMRRFSYFTQRGQCLMKMALPLRSTSALWASWHRCKARAMRRCSMPTWRGQTRSCVSSTYSPRRTLQNRPQASFARSPAQGITSCVRTGLYGL
nr:MAG TPA: hypothetical protein [Caudoviricetes sp.]